MPLCTFRHPLDIHNHVTHSLHRVCTCVQIKCTDSLHKGIWFIRAKNKLTFHDKYLRDHFHAQNQKYHNLKPQLHHNYKDCIRKNPLIKKNRIRNTFSKIDRQLKMDIRIPPNKSTHRYSPRMH